MLLETRQDEGVLIVTPLEKHLDGHVAPAFQTALLERIDAGARRIVVNLHCVQFMDSSGLGALVVALKRLGREGELKVCELSDGVRSMFELARLDRLIPILETERDTILSIAS